MKAIPRLGLSSVWLGLIVMLAACTAPGPAAAPTSASAPGATSLAPAVTTAPAAPAAPAAAKPTTPPAPTGELRIGFEQLGTESLDPIQGVTQGSYYYALAFDYLVGLSPDGQLSKDTGLATDWKVSGDNLTWTFTLRKGVKFQNGDDVTAEDAKFTLERGMGPKSKLGNAATAKAVIRSIDVPDPYTMVVSLNKPYATLPYFLSGIMGSPDGAVTPKKYIQEKGDDYFASNPIGSGPYRFVSQRVGSEMKFEAMPQHWRVGVPVYKAITLKIISEPTTMLANLKRGEADIVSIPVTVLDQATGFNIVMVPEASPIGIYLMQQWEDVPYKDIRVREALAIAIDRKAINDTLLGGTGTPNSYGLNGAKSTLGYTARPEIPYDPQRAKQLLANAGFAQGFDLNFYHMPRPGGFDLAKIAQMVVENWRAIGVRANIVASDYPTFRPLWFGKKVPQSAWVSNSQNYPLYDAAIRATLHSKGSGPITMDPKLDELIDALQQSPTVEEYAMRQGQVIKYVADNFIQIGLLYGGSYYATTEATKVWNPGTVPGSLNLDTLIRRR